jgi:hypothetical protein
MFMVCCLLVDFTAEALLTLEFLAIFIASIVGDSRGRVVIFVYAYYHSGNYQPGV